MRKAITLCGTIYPRILIPKSFLPLYMFYILRVRPLPPNDSQNFRTCGSQDKFVFWMHDLFLKVIKLRSETSFLVSKDCCIRFLREKYCSTTEAVIHSYRLSWGRSCKAMRLPSSNQKSRNRCSAGEYRRLLAILTLHVPPETLNRKR